MAIAKIALIGGQCAGKTTIMEAVRSSFESSAILKFADPIYGALKALEKPKNRAFMQDFGDLAKKHFGEYVFVDAFREKSNAITSVDLIACDDVRRTYEAELVHELGYFIVFVDTSEEVRKLRADALGLSFMPNHNSESEIASLRRYAHYGIDGGAPLHAVKTVVQYDLIPSLKEYIKNGQ